MANNCQLRLMGMSLKIIVPPHPLICHWLTMLRNESTPSALYMTALEQIGKWLTYEAIREWLPTRTEEIKTSKGEIEGMIIENRVPLLAIPNLPAGLHLWQGAKDLLPNADLCLGGIPKKIEENAGLIIFIDQISDGVNLLNDLSLLNDKGINSQRIKIITVIASSPGLKKIAESFSDFTIYAACIDPDLSEEGNIYPGIGNPSTRINTRITTSN